MDCSATSNHISFTSLTLQPLQAALQLPAAPTGTAAGATKDDRYSKTLEDVNEAIERAHKKAGWGRDNEDDIKTVRAKRTEIESLEGEAGKEFAATERHLLAKNLSPVILERHRAMVKETHYLS